MRSVLVMPTGLQVGYDAYFSSSPLGIETVAAHVRDCADVMLADMRGKGHAVQAHAEELLKDEPNHHGLGRTGEENRLLAAGDRPAISSGQRLTVNGQRSTVKSPT